MLLVLVTDYLNFVVCPPFYILYIIVPSLQDTFLQYMFFTIRFVHVHGLSNVNLIGF